MPSHSRVHGSGHDGPSDGRSAPRQQSLSPIVLKAVTVGPDLLERTLSRRSTRTGPGGRWWGVFGICPHQGPAQACRTRWHTHSRFQLHPEVVARHTFKSYDSMSILVWSMTAGFALLANDAARVTFRKNEVRGGVVEPRRFELLTSALQRRRSTN